MATFTNFELELQTILDVPAYVKERADTIREECIAEGATFFMTPAIPAEGKYNNAYEYERTMAISAYSDTHKDARGYRPRNFPKDWTLAEYETATIELEQEWDCDATMSEEAWIVSSDTLDESLDKWDLISRSFGYEV